MKDGVIVSWLVEIGDTIARGQLIAEIENNKIVIKMKSILPGTMVEVVHGSEVEVDVRKVIAYIEGGS
ncbi:MAG: biotin/lipoyl-containing protein [Acidimicrobiales bacterium]|jgi:pyruvate dehydrogenase E2 component (dihydrolipoamide acetyltransferase)|nr:biotin/lipoyl-containing protein [Acidimicrobiales bacterium]|tara:strand:- start:717 stop:920 length:204 start_codon:yes stop_codon:yes gene_type:complete